MRLTARSLAALAALMVFAGIATAQPDPKFARGAKPSPMHKVMAAPRHGDTGSPAEFAIVPPKLSYWDNERDGVCVSSEEAFAKAGWSVYCRLPEVFASEEEVRSFAAHHGWLNGATLTEVMDVMAEEGMKIGGHVYKDGPYSKVDYSKEPNLRSAISSGPVKIAIDAAALSRDAGNKQGWHSFGGGRYRNTDHCVGLSGYGTAKFCFAALKLPVPAGVDPAKPDCYLLFTWNTIGVVDHKWLMGTCTEAWVRSPTTPGQEPPVPPKPHDDDGGVVSHWRLIVVVLGGLLVLALVLWAVGVFKKPDPLPPAPPAA